MEKQESARATTTSRSQMLLPLASPAIRGLTKRQREEAVTLLAQLLLEASGHRESSHDS